jgi:hypothetical protein
MGKAQRLGSYEWHAYPRVVLTDGAIFHKDKLCGFVEKAEGDLRLCSVGDVVMLTDAEVEACRASGVELADVPEAEAAE